MSLVNFGVCFAADGRGAGEAGRETREEQVGRPEMPREETRPHRGPRSCKSRNHFFIM